MSEPIVIYSATDPGYPGYTVWFETAQQAFDWRQGVVDEYGSSPNIQEHSLFEYGGLIAFLNKEYHRDRD